MKMNLIKYSIFLLSLTLIQCCDNGVQNQFVFEFPEEGEVSYIDHVQPFLRARCATAPCHDVAYQAGGYDLSDWFAITKDQVLVNTNTPEASLILQVLDGRNPHLTNRGLILGTQNQVDGIRRWIEDGALPN